MDIEKRIRNALIGMLDAGFRIGMYPGDLTLLRDLSGSPKTGKKGIAYLDEKSGDDYVLRCECLKDGATLPEIKNALRKLLRGQGLKTRLPRRDKGDIVTITKEDQKWK